MQLEHELRVLPIDAKFEGELQALKAAGWEMAPGILPVAVYHLIRAKPEAPQPNDPYTVNGTMIIDESKITWLRDGKPIE